MKSGTHGTRLGLIMVAASAVVISFMPVAAKLAYLGGANPLAVMTSRSLIGMLGLGLFLLLRGGRLSLPFAAVKFGAITGVTQFLASGAFLAAIAFIDVSLGVLIIFIHTFLVAIYFHLRGKPRLSALQFLFVLSALAGLALALATDFRSLDPVGLVFAFAAMFAAAGMVVSGFKATEEVGANRANFLMTVWASLFFICATLLGPAADLFGPPVLPVTVEGWLGLVATGITFSLGYLLFFSGARLIGASRASILSISEPLITILFAMGFLGEVLTHMQWAGVLCVLGSLAGVEILRKKPGAG